ncbi:radical SAM protein [Tabrizicola sp.]|uniref:radical SAM protein n=1 Tax=Tabrizicola sp. TaxID=2005166 RepID=UPI002FDCFE50
MSAPLSGGRAARSGFLPDRTVHLHPLDLCNLACSHCYSASSPLKHTILPLKPLLAALPRLRAEGYEVISLSGGEPLLYPWLGELLAAAKAEGFRTAVISNGFRVTARHCGVIEALDRIAISFDGLEARHNAMRGNAQAWARAVAGLRYLAAIGKPAAAAFTVTRESLTEVPEFIELCADLGVRAVQLRPLVMAGRAPEEAAEQALSAADAARLWLMAQTLQLAWEGEVAVHVDLAPAEALAADRCAWNLALDGSVDQRLSDAVNPLVITPEGRLRPWTYDFPEEFDLGALQDLSPARRVWIAGGLPRLRRLLARTLQAAGLEEGFLDWFAFQRDQARRLPA